MSDDRNSTPEASADTAISHDAPASESREDEPLDPATRNALRENAKRVIHESGIGEMFQTLNRNALQGRGWFEEYDSGVIFKWGSGFTRRHIWLDISGDLVRFRLLPHIKCRAPVPVCDGEYHSFTPQMWRHRGAVLRELHRNYEHPVAETSED